MSIKEELDPNVLKAQKKSSIIKANKEDKVTAQEKVEELPVGQYLQSTVMPLVLEGMAEIAKIKPEDPLKFLADYLMTHSNEK